MNRAIVLLSGGLDSTTALALAIEQGRKCTALSLYYSQRHSEPELRAAQDIADHYGVLQIVREVSIPKGDSILMHHDAPMAEKAYSEIEGVSPTYVPNRNAIFLSLATSLALAGVHSEVWFAAHADDAENWAYPDCTPEFIGAMAAAIYIGTYHKVRLMAPFMHMTKGDIIREGVKVNVPYSRTRSCYTGATLHCGKCPTCISRKEAFKEAGVEDPTRYADA